MTIFTIETVLDKFHSSCPALTAILITKIPNQPSPSQPSVCVIINNPVKLSQAHFRRRRTSSSRHCDTLEHVMPGPSHMTPRPSHMSKIGISVGTDKLQSTHFIKCVIKTCIKKTKLFKKNNN